MGSFRRGFLFSGCHDRDIERLGLFLGIGHRERGIREQVGMRPGDISVTCRVFSVRVPVLSVQSISILPMSSIAVSRLTMTPCFASRSAPRESDNVVTTGSASGTTLTTSAMEKTTTSVISTLLPLISRFATKIKTRVTRIIRRMKRLNLSIPLENSLSFVVSTVSRAIPPIDVCVPVSSTSAIASPPTTEVPLKQRLWLS